MRRLKPVWLLPILLLLSGCIGARAASDPAASATPGCPLAIPWLEAPAHAGEKQTFTGIVALVQRRAGTIILGIYNPGSLEYFTATIRKPDNGFHTNFERAYLNKTLCVSGTVAQDDGSWTIEIDRPGQMAVLKGGTP